MARKSSEELKIINEEVRRIVFNGSWRIPVVQTLVAARLQVRKPDLLRQCEEFHDSLQKKLEDPEIHVLYRGSIAKALEILHDKRGTVTDKQRTISVLNATIKDYLEAIPRESSVSSEETMLLNNLLTKLYASPGGLQLVQQVEREMMEAS